MQCVKFMCPELYNIFQVNKSGSALKSAICLRKYLTVPQNTWNKLTVCLTWLSIKQILLAMKFKDNSKVIVSPLFFVFFNVMAKILYSTSWLLTYHIFFGVQKIFLWLLSWNVIQNAHMYAYLYFVLRSSASYRYCLYYFINYSIIYLKLSHCYEKW